MTKKAENLNTPLQPSLDIAGVSDSDIYKLAEIYAKEQCKDVKETLKYTPSEIYHLVRMVWIDGYKRQTYGGN